MILTEMRKLVFIISENFIEDNNISHITRISKMYLKNYFFEISFGHL